MLDHARLLSRFKVRQRMNLEIAISKSNLIKLIVLLVISAFLLSCETVGYYSQAARGQLAIVFGREEIQQLISDAETSEKLRNKFVNNYSYSSSSWRKAWVNYFKKIENRLRDAGGTARTG